MLDNNSKVTYWTSTGVSPAKIKSFVTNLEVIISNLAIGRVILKFNDSVLVKKKFFFV